MINRISAALSTDSSSRYRVLYGPGIQDHFIDADQQFIDFPTAIMRGLKQIGYRRVVFISPDKPIYFRDIESMNLTMKTSQQKEFLHESHQSKFTGPLGDFFLLEGSEGRDFPSHVISQSSDDDLEPYKRMNDSFAIKRIDELMMIDEGIPTAVVIMQAETFIRHQPDQRTLSGKIGRWQFKIQPQMGIANICLFVFTTPNYDELADITQRIAVPELRSFILNDQNRKDIAFLGYPAQDELERLLCELQIAGIMITETMHDKIIRAILAEGGNLSQWTKRLIIKNNDGRSLSIQKEWFSQYIPGEKKAFERLRELVGLENVNMHIRENTAMIKTLQQQDSYEPPTLHMMFVGNPGTGKTTVARLLGEIYFEIGLLKRGHLVEVQPADLIADVVGATGIKTNKIVDQALDGVLFIDEAYLLSEKDRGGFGQEALDTLLMRMENDRSRLVVIFAGYPSKMMRMRESNPGLPRRIPEANIIEFADFSDESLFIILKSLFEKSHHELTEETGKKLKKIVHEMWLRKDESFGNAGDMRNLYEAIIRQWALRITSNDEEASRKIEPYDIPKTFLSYVENTAFEENSFEKYFSDLVGLDPIKKMFLDLDSQIKFQRLTKEIHPEIETGIIRPQHMAFLGNPGTGKTTVARRVGQYFYELGILRKGHIVEVGRADLVGEYVGSTAQKTMSQVRKALDGVLFIDEAYSLTNRGNNDYGQEVIDTLVKVMEDYRNRLVVIFAGYTNEMYQFLSANSGLASRIPLITDFPDFSDDELLEILINFSNQEGYHIPSDVLEVARRALINRRETMQNRFGNARTVRNLFYSMKRKLQHRIINMDQAIVVENPELLFEFELADVTKTHH